ncbi:hypothetical protein [Myroides odoratimimus]|uniref:Uncharacterized protein n=1 Tax=Myroides odoratimimus CCUG 10230 TaxID=883150 RepID=A0ABP2X4Y4_9FLAO|nr:hypothetical protein [Myroides odoratimimus]EPC08639.1 hypothetical protein HMPREF9712_03629 [Myroides odoratimimus CCUG 10230]EPC08705.1 hypothetical protein HMPREF9712_03609 [Myroides odoratimimus CCUG 10230]MDM1506216.1 hypothetical protein [Myroides odoratimimus]MDM1525992.1 hypothetical protein [Myroides odoratimimus]MDM1537164.1 hypothetical protein [Myroides odoratimimus]
MIDTPFNIKVSNLHWLNNIDDESDLCAHGDVFLKIGDEVISNDLTQGVTVSATALYLLRSLTEDLNESNHDSQLIPCCGFLMYFDEQERLVIGGCPTGIDWTIEHLPHHKVRHISENGTEAIIDKNEYQKIVYTFVDEIENFYKNSSPKKLPTNNLEKDTYLALWKEWRKLRDNI